MRSDEKSTPFPPPTQSALVPQQRVAAAARDLIALDRRLGAVAESIEPNADELLPGELQAGIGVVLLSYWLTPSRH